MLYSHCHWDVAQRILFFCFQFFSKAYITVGLHQLFQMKNPLTPSRDLLQLLFSITQIENENSIEKQNVKN